MVDAISGGNGQNLLFQAYNRYSVSATDKSGGYSNLLTAERVSYLAQNKDGSTIFGSATQVTLSADANALLNAAFQGENYGIGSRFSPFTAADSEANELLEDIFRGVQEQLQFAGDAGPEGSARIREAGGDFKRVVDAIRRESNGQPLNEDQLERLVKADDAFHRVVDDVFGNDIDIDDFGDDDGFFDLSQSQQSLLQSLEQTLNAFFEQIEETLNGNNQNTNNFGGNFKLEQGFDKAANKLYDVFDQIFSSNRAVTDGDKTNATNAINSFKEDINKLLGIKI